MPTPISAITGRLALCALAATAVSAQATEPQDGRWLYEVSVTNDAFMALNAVPLPLPQDGAQTLTALAYDAGSEVNDELCSSIPGPFFAECGDPGGGARVGGGEGFVHVHRGVHGVGSLKASERDWRNPVASIRVRLVR